MVTFSAEKELSHHIIRIIFNLTGGCSRTIPSYRCVWISPVPICLGRLIHTHLMHTHGAYTRLHRLKPPRYSMSHTRADGSVGVPLCVPLGAYTRRIYAPSPVPSKVFHKSDPCGWLNRFKSHNTAQRVQNRLKITIFTG